MWLQSDHPHAGQLRKLASELGAELRRRLDQKCTHFVYQVVYTVDFG